MAFSNISFVDTSGFIPLISKTDLFHEKVFNTFVKLNERNFQLVTSDYVIDELLTWMRCKKKMPMETIIAFITSITTSNIELISITRDLFGESLALMNKYEDQFFSFTDCVSFTIMKEMKISDVITTDKHFTIAGFNVLI